MAPKQVLYDHDSYTGYPNKVYNYAEKYLRDQIKLRRKLDFNLLHKEIRRCIGYNVPVGTLISWRDYVLKFGGIPRTHATKTHAKDS